MATVIDKETGEVVGDKFAKMFFQDIERLFGLTPTERNILDLMIRDCRYGNKINLTAKKKKEYMDILGIKVLNSISNRVRALERKDVIKREEEGSTTYVINPELFFKGNDYQFAQILIKYSNGSREIEVINSKEKK